MFRIYVTDALKALAENTSYHMSPLGDVLECGMRMESRWIEGVESKGSQADPEPKDDPRPASEIAKDMWKRIRGEKQ